MHVVNEAVTSDSVMLLWNHASLPDTGDFSHYLVTWKKLNGQEKGYCSERMAETVKFGYLANGLEPETEYEFCVEALDIINRVIYKQTVRAGTQKCSKVVDVTMKPYLADGSGRTMDTYAIQKAIGDCLENGTWGGVAADYPTVKPCFDIGLDTAARSDNQNETIGSGSR